MKTKYGWLLAILIMATASGCLKTATANSDAPLIASGTIRAQEIRVASEFGGRIEAINVQVGQQVAAGDVIVTLDATPWLLQLSPAEAAVVAAQADLTVLEAGPHPAEVAAARANVTLAEAQRDGAYQAWQNALAVVENPQELQEQIVEARTKVALAAQGVELAEAQLANQQMARDITPAGSVQRQAADYQLLAAQEALAGAQADEKTAQTLLNQLLRIRNNPLGYIAQANAAEGKYLVAEQAVVVAQAKLNDLLAGPTPQELAVARAKVRQAEAEANVLRKKIERSALTSPINGVVVARAANIGELVAPAATILTLADLNEVTLEVYVPEGHIGRVTLGLAVQVTVDSFPGRVFEGQVIQIGDEPEFTPRNVATAEERLNTFYAVEIRLDNSDGALKPGMPADAQF
ncbi:MAG TPA: efflux RND transporter periplasmic adaptor subunit [Anaerolineae bacterium]|nr:efflux RND transporter periplasmic adaptor subunit [Anaerolineae bacterium]HQI86816.1 efflux RND transporter periplasmic adaptor subunit [Anaerolineae bacterium]